MDTFWHFWIIILTFTNLALVLWVLLANRKVAARDDQDPENKTTGHVYDGIEEYDNPLPKWWFMLFIATMCFAVVYLALYPGLGKWQGFLGWTSVKQLESEQQEMQSVYEQSYGKYQDMTVEALSNDDDAMKMAYRIFANNCAICHGSDGRGAFGFPNLRDDDWLWGGSPDQIKHTLVKGRQAAMPAWRDSLGDEGISNVTEYVLSLSGQAHDQQKSVIGEQLFKQNCAACHGADAKGQHAMGAPNLTDDVWLYGGSPAQIRQTLRVGRNGVMPAQEQRLHEHKIHLLTAYVYYMSRTELVEQAEQTKSEVVNQPQ